MPREAGDIPLALPPIIGYYASASMGRMYFSVRAKEKRSSARSSGSESASYISREKSQLSIWMRAGTGTIPLQLRTCIHKF